VKTVTRRQARPAGRVVTTSLDRPKRDTSTLSLHVRLLASLKNLSQSAGDSTIESVEVGQSRQLLSLATVTSVKNISRNQFKLHGTCLARGGATLQAKFQPFRKPSSRSKYQRPHPKPGKDAPKFRRSQRVGRVVEVPILGGSIINAFGFDEEQLLIRSWRLPMDRPSTISSDCLSAFGCPLA
jgi:hypothetical protein